MATQSVHFSVPFGSISEKTLRIALAETRNTVTGQVCVTDRITVQSVILSLVLLVKLLRRKGKSALLAALSKVAASFIQERAQLGVAGTGDVLVSLTADNCVQVACSVRELLRPVPSDFSSVAVIPAPQLGSLIAQASTHYRAAAVPECGIGRKPILPSASQSTSDLGSSFVSLLSSTKGGAMPPDVLDHSNNGRSNKQMPLEPSDISFSRLRTGRSASRTQPSRQNSAADAAAAPPPFNQSTDNFWKRGRYVPLQEAAAKFEFRSRTGAQISNKRVHTTKARQQAQKRRDMQKSYGLQAMKRSTSNF